MPVSYMPFGTVTYFWPFSLVRLLLLCCLAPIRFGRPTEMEPPVVTDEEPVLPVVPTLRDAVRQTRQHDSSQTRHARQATGTAGMCQETGDGRRIPL